MGWFRDYRSHHFVGQLYGLTLRRATLADATRKIRALDLWAWEREWKQNLKATHPNEELSAHSVREAAAWGAGARAAAGVVVSYPSPPYPGGSTWS